MEWSRCIVSITVTNRIQCKTVLVDADIPHAKSISFFAVCQQWQNHTAVYSCAVASTWMGINKDNLYQCYCPYRSTSLLYSTYPCILVVQPEESSCFSYCRTTDCYSCPCISRFALCSPHNQRWQWVSGSRVTGQVGQQIWVGNVGHGSVLVTRWPMIKLTRFQEQTSISSICTANEHAAW